jgi:hypothetical protein
MSRAALISLAGFALAGCANLATIPPGTPLAQVESRFGAPTLQCTDRQGHTRVIWSQQPLGQTAWGATVNAQGQVGAIEPVLTDEHFQVLKQGTWTPDEVRCEFGPPAIIDTVGLPSVRQIVWSYRYRQDHVWNSLMYVYFGQDGRQVTKFHPGPDPMYDRDRMFPRF